MSRKQRHDKLLQLLIADVQEIEEQIDTGDGEELQRWNEKAGGILSKLEHSMEAVQEQMLDEDETLEDIKQWTTTQKSSMKLINDVRSRIKSTMAERNQEQKRDELQHETEKQRIINKEIMKARIAEQKELDDAAERRIQREEEWLQKKIAMETTAKKSVVSQPSAPQTVKLQKYTITPFEGDYKDWIRFWNQFTVEVDGSTISEISKFNYLLELTKGKPRDDILGLPHTVNGYDEAKRILLSTYGKDIKVHKALVKELEGLHTITSVHKTASVHEFYNKLSRVVRTLSTMKKLDSVQSMVYTLMEKLGPVQRVLTQGDDDWEEWKLEELTENLRKYVERTPLQPVDNRIDKQRNFNNKDKLMMERGRHQQTKLPGGCVYCGNKQHRSSNCTRVLTIAGRRELLQTNKLCFNCTGTGHSAANCRSRNCFNCGQRHHTSICEKVNATISDHNGKLTAEKSLSASVSTGTTLHAMIKATVCGKEVRIMIDTGASSTYICSNLITTLGLRPIRKETRCIEQMFGTVTKLAEIYQVKIESNTTEGFSLTVNCINAEKEVLTYLPNPQIKSLKKTYRRMRRIRFSDEETTDGQLPIHIILGAADYQRIRSTEPPVLGDNPDTDPGAEFTMLGWILYGRMVSNDGENDKGFLIRSGQKEFERLCSLDVLGLIEEFNQDENFHQEFQEQLDYKKEGFYETRLPWKPDRPELPTNKELAAARLQATTKRLIKMGKLQEYDQIMQEQQQDGIIEPIPQKPTGEVTHYVPHQAVIREKAESTKLRIVYDCSAKESASQPSLNDCLENGPSLQPLLFDILLRNRMRYYCVTGDIKKAFLQVRINEQDRDALRILWYKDLDSREVKEYRFTRAIFGAGPSPYILNATIEKHVTQYNSIYPETTAALLKDTYVDDIQSGGDSVHELQTFKDEASIIMSEGGFELHKWHSNVESIESDTAALDSGNNNTPVNERRAGKILGVTWDKIDDTMSVEFHRCTQVTEPLTKRKILAAINGIYDLLGWASPVTVTGKILFSELCLNNVSWDERVPDDIKQRWTSWIKTLLQISYISVPRTVVSREIQKIILHGFADASKLATCAAVYTLCENGTGGVKQNLLVAKSRVASKNLSIPRLELVALHTLAKLMAHVKVALQVFNIHEHHMWTDSTTTLYWMASRGTWSKYVRNRVKAIKDLGEFTLHYVPTDQNPSDLGTRGTAPSKLNDFWFKGPHWLSDTSSWPSQPEITETTEASSEILSSKKKEVLLLEQEISNSDNTWSLSLLQKYKFTKLLRITAYIRRFVSNCKNRTRREGVLTTEEINKSEITWIKLAQAHAQSGKEFELKSDDSGVLRCYGRVPNYHPIYIPWKHPLAEKIVELCHQQTIHGGVQTTMSKVRERYWIQKLRRMVKSVRHKCNGCKRHRAKGFPAPTRAALPEFRVQFSDPFATTGVDFAGPIYYKIKKKETGKAYIALFTCTTTRAVHLKLCEDLTSRCFRQSLKEFVARRGAPRLMVSDNAKTFKHTAKWLKTLQRDDDVQHYLATERIEWKFNLSRAPWWGGFFERLIGITKGALSKAVGQALLTFSELEETLLDIECFMNNRPLSYVSEEFERRPLTPNILMRGAPATFLEDPAEGLRGEEDMTRRMRYLQRSRQQLRKRWIDEYLKALNERESVTGTTVKNLDVGRVVLIKDALKNSGKWKLGRIEGRIVGRDGVIRGYQVRTGNGYLVERPIQLVADLEIEGTTRTADAVTTLNPDASIYEPRARYDRATKSVAENRIRGIALNDMDETLE